MNNLSFVTCNFNDPLHQEKFKYLLTQYMLDPMGDREPFDEAFGKQLIDGLKNHASAFVVFALLNKEYIGMATCFYGFSTFAAKKIINIHDIIILKEFRGKNLGRMLLQRIEQIAKDNDCSKVTLEVREDNMVAQALYKSEGFNDCNPPMYFWQKKL